jgi:hypothetical protein
VTSQTKTKLKRWAKNSPIYLLMLIGLVAFIYFVLYRPLAIHQEKKNFEKAEASLNELYEKIVQKIGLPDQKKNNKSCGYSSVVFGRGDLGCAVSISALYENINSDSATLKMKQIATFIGNKLYPGAGTRNQEGFVPKDRNPVQSFRQDYKKFNDLSCTVSYSYPVYPTYSYSIFQTEFAENILIELSCGGPAKAEHYPVSN